MKTGRIMTAAATALATAAVLTGCGNSGDSEGDKKDQLNVVASTNVYADIAQQIAGDKAEVKAIIDDPNKDPHDYEASSSDKLTVSKADIVVQNGGGYDSFMDSMVESSDKKPEIVDAVKISGLPGSEDAAEHHHHHGDDEHGDHKHSDSEHSDEGHDEHSHDEHGDEGHDEHSHEGHDHGEFNEHVWYSVPTMVKVAHSVADDLKEKRPDDAKTFDDNAAKLEKDLGGLNDQIADVKKTAKGKKSAATEPVPLWLFHDMGVENITPDEFLEAVEEGSDVPPLVMKKAKAQVDKKQVAILAYNSQASNAQAEELKKAAEKVNIPVVSLTETTPEKTHYQDWMGNYVKEIGEDLQH